MKTTVELPDHVFRNAKALAAQKGQSLRTFFTQAIEEQLRRETGEHPLQEKWRSAFGALSNLQEENTRIQKLIEEEFEKVDTDEWR